MSYSAGYRGVARRWLAATANCSTPSATSSRTPVAAKSMMAALDPGDPGSPGAGAGSLGLVPVRPKISTPPFSTLDALVRVTDFVAGLPRDEPPTAADT